jgi:hypothetical protein
MRESLYWLRVIRQCDLAPIAEVQPLLNEANELTAMLTAGMKRLHPVLLVLLVAAFVLVLSSEALSSELSVLSSKFQAEICSSCLR